MATTSIVDGKTTNTTSFATSAICGESNKSNTVYVQVEPSRFRAMVQKLTGAPNKYSAPTRPISFLPPAKRPKLQERRRGMSPARLDIPFATHLRMISQIQKPTGDLALSPVSTIDYAFLFASNSPLSSSFSPTSFTKIAGPAVVLTKEEEEREEKVIAGKGFFLHNSPRGGENDAKPKLLPLFPVISSKAMRFSSSRS